MNIHYLHHVSYEGLGSIEDWAKRHKHGVTATRFFHEAPLPELERIDWLIVMDGPLSVNAEDIRFQDELKTTVEAGDQVTVLSAIAGG